MKLTDMTIEEMCTTTEKQSFDRKSGKIEAIAIAIPIIAFANADGGLLAVGIEDNGEITGIDDYAQDVLQEHTKNLAEIIIAEIPKNEKVTREQIAEKAGVSKKTVEREIKKMGNVHYVGRGYSGHWTID